MQFNENETMFKIGGNDGTYKRTVSGKIENIKRIKKRLETKQEVVVFDFVIPSISLGVKSAEQNRN